MPIQINLPGNPLRHPPNLRHPLWMNNGVERHFKWLCEKVHRPPENPEMIRLHVDHKVLLGIPFVEKEESIFILDTPAEIAAPASLLHTYGSGQGGNRLRQLYPLLGKGLHSHD